MFEAIYPGIVVQAVIGTIAVFGSVLVLFRSGKLRASARTTKIFMVALMAYAVFALVNLGAVLLFGFDIRTGKAMCAPVTEDIKVYPVRVDGDDLLADI